MIKSVRKALNVYQTKYDEEVATKQLTTLLTIICLAISKELVLEDNWFPHPSCGENSGILEE